MKAEVVQYEVIHAMEILDRNREIMLSKIDGWERIIQDWRTSGPAYTLLLDGVPVACAGVIFMGWSRGEAWTLLSPEIKNHPRLIFSQVKKNLEKIIAENGLRRVQAIVLEGHEEGKVFLEHLGFKIETPHGMKGFGPNGETFYMFGRV